MAVGQKQTAAYDAIVIGSGPNGLAAAIVLAKAGVSVTVLETKNTIGGGMRSAELTLPGYIHDVCSAVHPLAVDSPILSSLPLEDHGLEWVYPPAAVAHPFEDGSAVVLERDIEVTAEYLGEDDVAYRRLMHPVIENWSRIRSYVLGPLRFPRHPLAALRFAISGFQSSAGLGRRIFRNARSRAFFAGLSSHSMLPVGKPVTAAFGLVLATLGHTVGWPIAQGGSQKVADALAAYLGSLGGKVVTNLRVNSLRELPPARAYLFDVGPRALAEIAGEKLSAGYRNRLGKYRYGPGVFKIDWALDGPVPFRAAQCARAATVHIGDTFDEIASAEEEVWQGGHPDRPFVIFVQPTLFDPSRAPRGKHTAWAYCHVPNGSTHDMTEAIERQVERFAPGFGDLILARHTISAADMESYNPNYVGGDINGGLQDLRQLFARPIFRLSPYVTPAQSIYLCSASTPPGGGVHGMCGYHAARRALYDVFKIKT